MTSRKASPPSLKKDGNQVYLQFCSGLLCNSIMNLIIFKPIAMNITPPLSVNLACAKFTCGKVKWINPLEILQCDENKTVDMLGYRPPSVQRSKAATPV